MAEKEYQSYADCIGCKSNNIVDILKDYIVKYESPEELKKYNLRKDDLISSIRFLLTNIENPNEYFQVLIISITQGAPEIIKVVLDYSQPISKTKREELINTAKNKAKKAGPKQKECQEVLEILEKHTF